MDNQALMDMLPLLVPLAVFQLGFQIFCIIDWAKRSKFRFNNRWIWLVLILIFNVLGGILYLAVGREEE